MEVVRDILPDKPLEERVNTCTIKSVCLLHWLLASERPLTNYIIVSIRTLSSGRLSCLHIQKWHQHLKHALTIHDILSGTIEFNNSFSILVQMLIIFKMLGAIDIFLHRLFVLPFTSKTGFLLAKFTDVGFYFFTVKNLLQIKQSFVLEGQFFVLEDFVEVCCQFSCLELG